MAQHIYTYINPCSEKDISKAITILLNDGVIAYPTDVGWAIGCDSSSVKAVEKIRRMKPQHPKNQPFSLICDSFSMISSVADLSQTAYRLLKKVLPGPYTIILKRDKSLPKKIHDKRLTVGVRIPDAPLLLELVKRLNKPLLTTSMPKWEERSLHFGYEIEEAFGHFLDLILDLGEEAVERETTIIDATENFEVLREGAGDISLFTYENDKR